jgi:hypothetical protein
MHYRLDKWTAPSPLPSSGFTITRYEYVGLEEQRKRIPSFDNDSREIWAGHTTLFQTKEEGFPQGGIFVGSATDYAKAGMNDALSTSIPAHLAFDKRSIF